jgi:hypothetical protein
MGGLHLTTLFHGDNSKKMNYAYTIFRVLSVSFRTSECGFSQNAISNVKTDTS